MAYIIYCDESAGKGIKYSDFFGGCILNSTNQFEITKALEEKKEELSLKSIYITCPIRLILEIRI